MTSVNAKCNDQSWTKHFNDFFLFGCHCFVVNTVRAREDHPPVIVKHFLIHHTPYINIIRHPALTTNCKPPLKFTKVLQGAKLMES